MLIPLLAGITTDAAADFRSSYPLNLVPVPKETGVSKGYLRTSDGMIEFANSIYSDSNDRGAINWDGICYRVIGDWLTRVNADQTVDYLGQVVNDGKRVVMVNGFDRLAIAAGGLLYYWSPALGSVQQVTDPDLGLVLDVIWIAGYFMTTDGENLVVTELNDPFQVNPLKYGSSEASPDPINGLLAIRNEVYAINRFTTEIFQNVGGANFPFQRNEGAMIPKGSIGTHASCYYGETFAFVGSGNSQESLSVYVGAPGQAQKIATREIEIQLQGYTEAQLAEIVLEQRSDKLHDLLYIHLPDKSAVFDAAGSAATGERVWFYLASGPDGDLAYRARNYVQAYGKWLFGDLQSQRIGYFSDEDAREFGVTVPWQFDTMLVYNEGNGAIFHNLELVRLPGRLAHSYLSPDPNKPSSIFMSWTEDGLTWSNPRPSPMAKAGQTQVRCAWRKLGRMSQWRGLRFRGMNNPAPDAIARLEAKLEPLVT
jgi:hypothetical protein